MSTRAAGYESEGRQFESAWAQSGASSITRLSVPTVTRPLNGAGQTGAGVSLVCTRIGLGAALLPSHVVAAEVTAGRLVRLLAQAPLPRVDVWLVHPTHRSMPSRVQSLIDFLVARFRDRAWQRRALLAPARRNENDARLNESPDGAGLG